MVLTSTRVLAENTSFQSTLRLLAPNSITEVQPLEFPITTIGQDAIVTVSPADVSAAVFIATGSPSTAMVGSVVENQIWVDNGLSGKNSNKIKVGNFTVGGNMGLNGNTVFDGRGIADNLRVGATAEVRANDPAGTYTGTATFRVLYI